MEDYLKTNVINLEKAYRISEKVRAERGDEFADNVYKAIIADQSYLEAAWEVMGENYYRDRLGIEDEEIMEFRRTILQ